MDIAYSVASMALYLVFFSCLATFVMTREISFVLWGNCQNLLDDPRMRHSPMFSAVHELERNV